MKRISFDVSEDTFQVLEVGKARYGTWKEFILSCIMSKFRRYLALPGYQEHIKRGIQKLQTELDGPVEAEPRAICPHCLKEF